jgi:hypothetical protein
MRFETKRAQNEKKKCFAIWKNLFSLWLFCGLSLWLCISKLICIACLRRCSYNILIHSKRRTIEKDLQKCLVIGKQSMMGWFILCCANMISMRNLFCDLQIIDEIWAPPFSINRVIASFIAHFIAQRKPYFCCTLTCKRRPYNSIHHLYGQDCCFIYKNLSTKARFVQRQETPVCDSWAFACKR